MSNPKFRLYTAQEVAEWLLAEQAHRYQEDLSRLGDERDEAVAQHDRDAETIAELRTEVGYWNNDYAALLAENARLREEIACVDRCDKSCVELTERLTAERDEARSMLKLAEGVAAALPDPDKKSLDHARFVLGWVGKFNARELDGATSAYQTIRRYVERLEARGAADQKLIDALANAARESVSDLIGALGLSSSAIPKLDYEVMARDALSAAGLLALDAARAEAGQ